MVDDLQLSLIKHANEIVGLGLIGVLAFGVLKYRNIFVSWIVIFATVRATYPDHAYVDLFLGNAIAVMLTILIYRYMKLAIVYAGMRRGADIAAIKHATNTAIIATDVDRKVVSWDKASERLFDRTAADTVGTRIQDAFNGDTKKVISGLLECAIEGKRCIEHIELDHANRKDRIGVTMESKPAQKDGRIIGMLMSVRADRRGQDYAETHSKVVR